MSWRARNLSLSAGSDAKAVIARCRRSGESPMTQSSSVPSSCSSGPVKRPRARAAWTQTSGSGWSKSGCKHLERPTDELGVGRRRHPARAHLEASGGEHAATERAVRGAPDHGLEGRVRSPEPGSESRDLEGAGPGLPDRGSRGGHAPRCSPASASRFALPDERRARERVEQRSLDDPMARDRRDPIAEGRLRARQRKEASHQNIAPPDARRAPREEDLAARVRTMLRRTARRAR